EQAAELLEQQVREQEMLLAGHRQFQEDVFASSSWRLTAPLRRLKILLGASPPAAPSRPDEKEKEAPWDSLVPMEFPPEVLVAGPDAAATSNRRCEIVRPETMLAGLLPEMLLETPESSPS